MRLMCRFLLQSANFYTRGCTLYRLINNLVHWECFEVWNSYLRFAGISKRGKFAFFTQGPADDHDADGQHSDAAHSIGVYHSVQLSLFGTDEQSAENQFCGSGKKPRADQTRVRRRCDRRTDRNLRRTRKGQFSGTELASEAAGLSRKPENTQDIVGIISKRPKTGSKRCRAML